MGILHTFPRTASADRQFYIGASEAAACLGLSRFETPMGVWMRKTNQLGPQEDNPVLRRGNYLEAGVRQWTADVSGAVEVEAGIPISEAGIQGPEPWMSYHPDGALRYLIRAAYEAYAWHLYEGKTSRLIQEWGLEEDGSIPADYLIQVHYQLACSPGIQAARVGVYFPVADTVRVYQIDRDEDFNQWLIDTLGNWVQRHIVQGDPPAIDASPASSTYLRKVFPQELKGLREATDAEVELALSYAHTKRVLKEAEAHADLLKNKLAEAIGENAGLITPSGNVTWKWQAGARRVDTEALRTRFPDIAAEVSKQGEDMRVLRHNIKLH